VYTTESIIKAYKLSRPAIVRDLQALGVCGPFSGWTRDELEARWLESYGERTGDTNNAGSDLEALLTCELCGALTTGAHPLAVWHYCSTCHARVYRAAMADAPGWGQA
jgi:hypothetical protein